MIRIIYVVSLLTWVGFGAGTIRAQTNANSNASTVSTNITSAPSAPVVSASATPATADTDEAPVQSSDFMVNGVPYAKVLYLQGNVWIRPPSATFHRLAEDELIAAQSVIYTGFNGTLDFATGPGMAVRMVPGSLLVVDQLPHPPSAQAASSPPPVTPAPAAKTDLISPTISAPAPEASVVSVKKGTIFSALGRDDGQPIDFQVRTPEGVAGAKGTMFSTTASQGQTEVSMLHGTVNFQTPDQQASQITAGESQQISGSAGHKYQLGQRHNLNPADSETFFNHAGGLLEHASGYGVVRRGLGPEVARTLQERGYKLSAMMQQRFQNAGKTRYRDRPMFNRTHATYPGARPAGVHPNLASPPYHPVTPAERKAEGRPATKEDENAHRRRRRDE